MESFLSEKIATAPFETSLIPKNRAILCALFLLGKNLSFLSRPLNFKGYSESMLGTIKSSWGSLSAEKH